VREFWHLTGVIAVDEIFVGREVELAFMRGRLEETSKA
jgi:hypothetical protein